MNRRFVCFFFNTSGLGCGEDAEAKAFVEGKLENPYAYFSAFLPDGTYLRSTEIYADKDDVFEFLRELLEEFPDYAVATQEERAVLERGEDAAATGPRLWSAARLREALGEYGAARVLLDRITDSEERRAELNPETLTDTWRLRARMARHQRDWEQLEAVLTHAESELEDFTADALAERCHRWLATEDYEPLITEVGDFLETDPRTSRLAELHFALGVAHWFQEDVPRASYHWCFVSEFLPDDRLARRAYIAAAHRGMPYPNPELGNFASDHRGGNIDVIKGAYARALEEHHQIAENRVP